MALLALVLLAVTTAPPSDIPPLGDRLAGAAFEYTLMRGDTLADLASRFGVDARTIARRNRLQPSAPVHPGAILVIDAVHIVAAAPPLDVPIVINVPQRHLFLTHDEGVQAYPIAVGRPTWKTPLGRFTVTLKEEDPTWDVPTSIQEEMRRTGKPVLKRVPASPANPLGKYWIGLSLPNVGVHGTNAPRSVYTATTHGCIRVRPERIATLYRSVDVGMAGVVVYQPTLVALVGGRVYVEVHRDIYETSAPALDAIQAVARAHQIESWFDWPAVKDAVKERAGVAVDVTATPIPVTR